MAIQITETFYPKSKEDWQEWLDENHKDKKEIWVVFFKKSTGKQTVTIQDAIDEALCLGWIDNIEKGIDEERYALRFTPRAKNSNWSENNIKRYNKLLEEGLITESGKQAFKLKSKIYKPKMKPGGAKWHESHRMPKNPSTEQRVTWHKEHQFYCACRPIPKSLAKYF